MNEQIPFSINQLKITHFHWNSGEIKEGTPIRTSVELKSEFDFEINSGEYAVCKYIKQDKKEELIIQGILEKVEDE